MSQEEQSKHHTDSSNFENTDSELKKRKIKQRNQKYRVHRTRSLKPVSLYMDCDEYPVKLKKEKDLANTNEKRNKLVGKSDRKTTKQNGILPVKSKLSIMANKLMPRLSNMFKCSNNANIRNMAAIEENGSKNTRHDNRCQQYSNDRRRMRKLYEAQNFVIQPVYAIEGNAHKTTTGPFIPTKITDEPLLHHKRKTKNQYSSYCSLSSSDSDTQSAGEKLQKVDTFRKRLKAEIKKEHVKYQQSQSYRSRHQNASKDNNYYVFSATPIHSTSHVDTQSALPTSSSSFWDYLFAKARSSGKRYETQRVEMQGNQQIPIAQNQQKQPNNMSQQDSCFSGVCCQRKVRKRSKKCTCKRKGQSVSSPPTVDKHCSPKCSAMSMARPPSPPTKDIQSNISSKSTQSKLSKKEQPVEQKEVQCQCSVIKKVDKLVGDPSKQSAAESAKDPITSKEGLTQEKLNLRPCQLPHDELTKSLGKKYNGEVICIHNPPCILINGCLNLPPQDDQPQNKKTFFWPVTTTADLFRNKDTYFQEQSCQYQAQVLNNEMTDRAEKKTQSVCHHTPNCEVVRGCCKPRYDPELHSSCIHVPMCKKLPECVVLNTDRKKCVHKPKCREVPVCSRDFVVLTAKKDFGSQVVPTEKQKKDGRVCRHEPACIMIPKCIGKALSDSTYVHVDAIPGCIHQPSCDLIPACCRKPTKDMVSVSSQYPNSCRIV